MKSIYIVILIVVVVGGVVLFNFTPKEVTAPVVEDTSPQTGGGSPTATEHGMTAEEHSAMMGNSTQGTDVGMEMPEMEVTPASTPMKKEFIINGSNFAFDVKDMRVKKGDTVTIHFMSADGFHDLVIDAFNARTEKIKTGGMAMVTFVADKVGTFEYYCSVGSHRMNGMVGKLIVE